MSAAGSPPISPKRASWDDRLRFAAAGVVLLGYWAVSAATWLPLSWLVLHIHPQPWRREMGQVFLKGFFRGVRGILKAFGVIEVSYHGFERLEAQSGPLILAPNHPALWDAVLVMSEADHASCVVKSSLMRNPLLSAGSLMAGFIPNEPAHQTLRHCIKRLRAGERLLFFPEGTRSRPEHGRMNPLSGGLAIIARSSGAPVWPVIIQTTSPYLGKGWPIWRLPPESIRIRLTLGEPVLYGSDESAEDFLARLRETYVAAGCGLVEA